MKFTIIYILAIGLLASCSLKEDRTPEVKEITPERNVEQLRTDLFEAVLNEDFRSVENLIKNGVSLEGFDQQGHTVLMRAVQLRSSIMVNILIEGGAKIFAPMQNDLGKTALSKIHPSDNEIVNLFDKEKQRLREELVSLISSDNYIKAQSFIIDNNIPFTFEMEEEVDLPSYVISNVESVDHGEIPLIKYFFETGQHQKIKLFNYKDQVIKLGTKLKDKDFFDYCVKMLSSNSGIGKNLILSEDSNDTDWFSYKLSVLRKYNIAVEIDFLLAKQPRLEISSKNSYVALHQEILPFIETDYDKNRHFKKVLDTVIEKSKEDNSYISWVSPLISMWSKQGIDITGYSIDEMVVAGLSSVKMINYDFATVQNLVRSLLKFTENRDTIQTFNYIFSSNHMIAQKLNLVELVLSYSNELSEGVFALAAKSDTVLLLNKLLDSNLPFNASEQANAVLAALENTSSGDVAKSILLILKEKGIPFDTEEGAKALMFAYRKMWEDNDETYSKVVDFLLSTSPSPVNSLKDNEKVNLLAQQLNFILSGEKNLSDLEHLLQKMNPPIMESITYEKNYFLHEDSKVKLSFVWDYIISMYDYIKDNPEKLSHTLSVLNRIIKKFPNEKTAMLFKTTDFVPDSNITTRQILPLSLMLSQPNQSLYQAIFESTGYPSTSAYAPQVSLESFYNGIFYNKYSENKEYWENVTNILLSNGHTISSGSGASYSYFINSLFESRLFSKYPVLSKRIEVDKIDLHLTQRGCAFKEIDYTDLYKENQFEKVNGWTTLGSFEALSSLARRTCSGGSITSGELKYIKSFINKNLEVPRRDSSSPMLIYQTPLGSFEGFRNVKKVNCRDYRNENRGPYTWDRTALGVAFRKIIDDELISTSNSFYAHESATYAENPLLGDKCWHYEYSQEIHNLAKIAFLNNWLKCAVDNNKTNLVSMFESLNSDFNITASDDDFGIKLCKL